MPYSCADFVCTSKLRRKNCGTGARFSQNGHSHGQHEHEAQCWRSDANGYGGNFQPITLQTNNVTKTMHAQTPSSQSLTRASRLIQLNTRKQSLQVSELFGLMASSNKIQQKIIMYSGMIQGHSCVFYTQRQLSSQGLRVVIFTHDPGLVLD